MVEVTQADREAAAEALPEGNWAADTMRDLILAGLADDRRQVQAAARHRTTSTDELLKGLEFYADPDGDGYDVMVTNYGLSTEVGDIIRDRGKRARALIAKHRPASSGDQT